METGAWTIALCMPFADTIPPVLEFARPEDKKLISEIKSEA